METFEVHETWRVCDDIEQRAQRAKTLLRSQSQYMGYPHLP